MTLSTFEWGLVFLIPFIGVYLYGFFFYFYMNKRGVKNSKTRIPYCGDFYTAFKKKENLIETIDRVYKAFPNERYVGFFEIVNEVIIVKDVHLIRQVCTENSSHFADHRKIINDEKQTSLFCLRGNKWKETRDMMAPAFLSDKIGTMVPLGLKCADNLISYLKTTMKESSSSIHKIEANKMFVPFVHDILVGSYFGYTSNSYFNPENEYFTNGRNLSNCETLQFVNKMAYTRRLSDMFHRNGSVKKAKQLYTSMLKANITNRKKNHTHTDDFLQHLIDAGETLRPKDFNRNNTCKSDSNNEDDLLAQSTELYIAGRDTLIVLLSFLFYEFSTNESVFKKLQTEIDRAAQTKDFALNVKSLDKLEYLDMVICETLRKWPPMIATDRECTKPFTFPPPNDEAKTYTFLTKYALWIPIYSIHRDARYFSNPEAFNPERFSPKCKENIKPFAFIPFGAGPRKCIGSEFAITFAKLVTFKLLSNFHIQPTSKTKSNISVTNHGVFLKPKEDIWIGLKIRN